MEFDGQRWSASSAFAGFRRRPGDTGKSGYEQGALVRWDHRIGSVPSGQRMTANGRRRGRHQGSFTNAGRRLRDHLQVGANPTFFVLWAVPLAMPDAGPKQAEPRARSGKVNSLPRTDMNGPDVLRIVDAMHRDKNIPKDVIFKGIEDALALAAQKFYGEEQ